MDKEKLLGWSRRAWLLPLLALACLDCRAFNGPPRKPVPRRLIAELAANLAGIPYRFGGFDIDGFDCSGLVFYVYDCFGIDVPRDAREQGRLPGRIQLKHAAAADILVFKSRSTWHSAIYLGNGRFIHAPSSGGWVRTDELNASWLSRLRKVITLWPRVR
ncbi:MAG TPA: C40 family peptidase [Candidatus Binatia bacterium]|nr:C40 family peptidase [Candidatus Binatia bacterium]